MRTFIEVAISALIILTFIFILYLTSLNIEDFEIIKLKIYEIFKCYNIEIRNYAFLNETSKIEEIIRKNIPKIYNVSVLVCSEKGYQNCFRGVNIQQRDVFSVSYFLSSNFTNFENLEIIIYVWKEI